MDCPALDRLEPRDADHQPLGTLLLEINMHARVRALAFEIEHHSLAEFTMAHARAQADPARGGLRGIERPAPAQLAALGPVGLGRAEAARAEVDARAHLIEQRRGYFLDKARGD